MRTEPVLRVRDLTTCFDGDETTTVAVNGLSFDLLPGETLGLVGESGCGKSVTSLSIMRLLRAPGRVAGGAIEFAGQDLLALREGHARHPRQPAVDDLPGADDLAQPRIHHRPPDRRIADAAPGPVAARGAGAGRAAADLVQISDPARRVHEYPYQLSGGMRQRAMIAMALACQPKVLIADEPTTALDVTIQAQILHLLRDIQARLGTAIVLITHDLGVVAQMPARHRDVRRPQGRGRQRGRRAGPSAASLHAGPDPLAAGLRRRPGHDVRLAELPGIVPVITPESRGCAFAARCPQAMPRCTEEIRRPSTPPSVTAAGAGLKRKPTRSAARFPQGRRRGPAKLAPRGPAKSHRCQHRAWRVASRNTDMDTPISAASPMLDASGLKNTIRSTADASCARSMASRCRCRAARP